MIMSTATRTAEDTSTGSTRLPTMPCSVVWSQGHAYVLEGARWVGLDNRRRALWLTHADLQRRGWSRTRTR